MRAQDNGIWDFQSYDEKTWFRFIVILLLTILSLYCVLHSLYYREYFSREYTRLDKEQAQFIGQIYIDSASNMEKGTPKPNKTATGPSKDKRDTSKRDTLLKDSGNLSKAKTTEQRVSSSCKNILLCNKVIDYLQNTFDGNLDQEQLKVLQRTLCTLSPLEATAFLNNTRFKVTSCFWLIGPCVYWEIIFWAMFGVLSSLLFNLGVVGSSSTTDPSNSRSIFDSSEIYGQVAKILYAPLCTLAVILGYNYFKDQSIVDISSSKGVIVFSFISGFYSSRLIALMDRLKEVLLPNSGTAALPITQNKKATAGTTETVKVRVDILKTTDAAVLAAALPAINNATVELTARIGDIVFAAYRTLNDADGTFTFKEIPPGDYYIKGDLAVTLQDGSTRHLTQRQSIKIILGMETILLTLH